MHLTMHDGTGIGKLEKLGRQSWLFCLVAFHPFCADISSAKGREGTSMQFELTASMMCADYSCVGREVGELEESGIDSFYDFLAWHA